MGSESQFIYCYQLISTPGHPNGSEKHGVGELWGGADKPHLACSLMDMFLLRQPQTNGLKVFGDAASSMQWWMDLFEDMMFCGMLDTSNVNHVECIRYCFMDVIQDVACLGCCIALLALTTVFVILYQSH